VEARALRREVGLDRREALARDAQRLREHEAVDEARDGEVGRRGVVLVRVGLGAVVPVGGPHEARRAREEHERPERAQRRRRPRRRPRAAEPPGEDVVEGPLDRAAAAPERAEQAGDEERRVDRGQRRGGAAARARRRRVERAVALAVRALEAPERAARRGHGRGDGPDRRAPETRRGVGRVRRDVVAPGGNIEIARAQRRGSPERAGGVVGPEEREAVEHDADARARRAGGRPGRRAERRSRRVAERA
jgi:hypothetical protein